MLAAGSARRFGGDKRLQQLADGDCMLQASVKRVLEAQLPILVCLREYDVVLEAMLNKLQVPWLPCSRSVDGMGATLAQGMEALPAWDGVLIALADMPWINPATFMRVCAAVSAGTICQPVYRGQGGLPVGFGRQFFSELAQLQGDSGARGVVERHSDHVIRVELEDPGILQDIDTPGDLVE